MWRRKVICPQCGSARARVIKTFPYAHLRGRFKHVYCADCATYSPVWETWDRPKTVPGAIEDAEKNGAEIGIVKTYY